MNDFSEDIVNLSQEQRELLELLLNKEGINTSRLPIPRRSSTDSIPFSCAQQRIWSIGNISPDIPSENIALALRIFGPLNVSALDSSIHDLVKRHEILRTTCSTIDGQPTQTIAPTVTLSLPVKKLGTLSKTNQENEIRKRAIEVARKPFDLTKGPLLRLELLEINKREYVFLLTTHQFVTDGWSMGILLRDLSTLYEAATTGTPSPLLEVPIQYADFSIWQRKRLREQSVECQLSYWMDQLAGSSPMVDLPIDRARPLIPSFKGGTEYFSFSPALSESIRILSRREGVTMFMTVLAVFQILLHRLSGQDDVMVGTSVSNRNRLETEELVGNFSNNLFLRSNLSDNPSLHTLLTRVRSMVTDAYANQEVPLEKVIEKLQQRGVKTLIPQFHVMFMLRDSAPEQNLKLPGLMIKRLPFDLGTARLDLNLDMTDGGGALSGTLEYKTDLFERSTIKRIIMSFQKLLEKSVADPDQRVSMIGAFMESKTDKMMASFNKPDGGVNKPRPQRDFLTPRDKLEVELARIWEKVLGVRPIGIIDNFFELGGHSLLAVILFSEIEKKYNRFLPLATLFQAPTIQQLAEILRKKNWSPNWSSLVAIQPSGSKPPFFCIHGAGGNVLNYYDLARHLGSDQPFYGLQARGLDGEQPFYTKIEDMAANYIKEIRAVQPEGPYYLGGYCMGGTVAFEIAQQLQAQGQKVALLALFETYATWSDPGSFSLHCRIQRFVQRIAFHIGNAVMLRPGDLGTFISEKMKVAKRRIKRIVMVKLSRVAHKYHLRSGSPLVHLMEINDRAAINYIPSPYQGKITLFRPKKLYAGSDDPQLGWDNKLAATGMETHTIPAYPAGMLIKPIVRYLAENLNLCLEKTRKHDLVLKENSFQQGSRPQAKVALEVKR